MKRNEIKRRPLADTVLNKLEPEEKEYRELDSPGLYFRVTSAGSKSWQLRYKKPDNKWAWMGLGAYPEVSGALAREKAKALQDQLSRGHDISVSQKTQDTNAKLFKTVAEQWLNYKLTHGLSKNTTDKVIAYLHKDILPALGHLSLDDITRADCVALQANIEKRGAFNIAEKVRGWVNQIFGFAIASGLTDNDPAARLGEVAKKAPETEHYPHLTEKELPDFLRALHNSKSRPIALTAAWLCIYTAARPGMVRFAEWSEFDLDNAIWTVPAEKMKMRRDYVSPLPTQAVEKLKFLFSLTGRSQYAFPGIGNKNPVISENTINGVFNRIGYKGKMVGHGARHTASTLLREHDWPKDHVEAQLAHVEGGIAGVYNKAQYLEQRAKMMQWYACYLDALASSDDKE